MIVRPPRQWDELDIAVNRLFRGEPLPEGFWVLTRQQALDIVNYVPPKRKKKKRGKKKGTTK